MSRPGTGFWKFTKAFCVKGQIFQNMEPENIDVKEDNAKDNAFGDSSEEGDEKVYSLQGNCGCSLVWRTQISLRGCLRCISNPQKERGVVNLDRNFEKIKKNSFYLARLFGQLEKTMTELVSRV